MAVIAVAFPKHAADRERVRLFALRLNVSVSMPPLNGIDAPCSRCGMELDVGPRVARTLAKQPATKVLCPFCLGYEPELHASRQIEFANEAESEMSGDPRQRTTDRQKRAD